MRAFIAILFAVLAFVVAFLVGDAMIGNATHIRPKDVFDYRFGIPTFVGIVVGFLAYIELNKKK